MLTRLSVSNFAIINELDIHFGPGLSIITGETGAGKSILLGALRLILGERADLKQLNNPEVKCIIEASFNIDSLQLQAFFDQNELDYDAETILRRELLPSGKSRAFINDTPVTLNIIQELGEKLIDIHSQFNTQNLIESDYQLQILDAYAGQLPQIKKYQQLLSERNQKTSELKALKEKLDQLAREADYKQFLLDELENAQLQVDELEGLETELSELQHIEVISQSLTEVEQKLDSADFGVLIQLHESQNQLQKIADFATYLNEFKERLESARIELADIQSEIHQKLMNLEADPARLEVVKERLDLIQSLLHKHRVGNLEELGAIHEQLAHEQADFNEMESKIDAKVKEIDLLEAELDKQAQQIHQGRKSVIPQVEQELLASLAKLGMENSQLKIELNPKTTYSQNGKDEIDFLFSANKGMAMQTVGKAISGGERSRLMMAVKKSLAGKLALPTLILDEIDTGVSGKVANEMGNMMKEMAQDLQLISITHLAQVAAKAQQHYRVQKQTTAEKTFTEVVQLGEEERLREIAELISGSNVSETALAQAKELMGS